MAGMMYGKPPTASAVSDSDWPTYRRDAARSGGTTVAAPAGIELAWQTDLGGRLTSVVVADGKAFVAQVDAHPGKPYLNTTNAAVGDVTGLIGITGYEIAASISEGLARVSVAIEVNGIVVDLNQQVSLRWESIDLNKVKYVILTHFLQHCSIANINAIHI